MTTDDMALVIAVVTSVVNLIGIVANAVLALRLERSRNEEAGEDRVRATRQRDIDQVLAHLDDFAELAGLYRILLNATDKLQTDPDGRPLLDEAGRPRVERRHIYPDERLEEGLIEIEGKDTRSFIKLQAFRIHRRHAPIGDLLGGLDPTGVTGRDLGLLYLETVQGVERASQSGDFWALSKALEGADDDRTALRARIQALVEPPKRTAGDH